MTHAPQTHKPTTTTTTSKQDDVRGDSTCEACAKHQAENKRLMAEIQRLESDVRVAAVALSRVMHAASGLHTQIELLGDVNTLALLQVSPKTRAALGIQIRGAPAPSIEGGGEA